MSTNKATMPTNDKAAPRKVALAAQGSAVRGASLLIVLQVASRAVTFIANQLLLRFLTVPELLGISTQLEVYYLSVLFFARESLRVAIQRQGASIQDQDPTPTERTESSGGGDKSSSEPTGESVASPPLSDSQAVVNIAHLALVLGAAAATGLGAMYLRYVDADTAASTPFLNLSLWTYGLAAMVELLSEPAFVALQYRLRFGPRAAAESAATLLRCVATFGSAGWAWKQGRELGVLPFALGQLAYGFGLLAVYTWNGTRLASSEGFSLMPRKATTGPSNTQEPGRSKAETSFAMGYFYRPTLQLASSMMAQSFVKHLLTQGDTFLVSILSDPRSQGIYALANNYGSLLARLVFQPIEESSRNYFSKLLSDKSPASTDTSTAGTTGQASSDSSTGTSKEAVDKARVDLQALLKFYVLLSAVIVSLGPFAAPLLVQIVAGSRWSASGAGRVLAQYCLYIPLLAFNGVAEAFVASVATGGEVHRQSVWMSAFSVAFGVAGFVSLRLLDLGAVGLVYANAVNMVCRIVWSGHFISTYFRKQQGAGFGWSGVTPSATSLHVVATAALWAGLSNAGIVVGQVSPHVFRDLATVAAFAVPYAAVIAYAERNYLAECYRTIRGRRGSP